MSKIALSSNTSGTGVFTIESLGTNTNRTLTLPDASGTVFNQGNILGTVSESAGVPTGAIIETGSNANGEFTKFADGTMICWFSFATSASGVTTKTLPATFIDTNYTAVGGTNTNSSASDFTAKFSSATTTTIGIVMTSNGSYIAATVRAMIIGRWF